MTWVELTMGMAGLDLSGSPERLVINLFAAHSWVRLAY